MLVIASSSSSSNRMACSRYLFLAVILQLPCFLKSDICRKPICEYDFVISRSQTMTYVHSSGTVFNVMLNGSSLVVAENSLRLRDDYPDIIGTVVDPSQVITADGYPRDIIVINGQFPGPAIEVLEGSQIVVRVRNNLFSEVTSIHWHGIHLRNNYFMDGVPYLTQCPIFPRQIFTYRFEASPVGTHWYHSHHANQRIDGLYGMLIIHPRSDEFRFPSHNVFVSDWYHMSSDALALRSGNWKMTKFTGEVLRHPSNRSYSLDDVELSSMQFVSALFGARGRHDHRDFPLEVFRVKSGTRHPFRMVNAGADFSFEVSADQHSMEVVALDGYDIRPIRVDSAIIHPGESLDFLLLADQPVGRYWLRAQTLLHRKFDEELVQEVRAVLEYADVELETADPTSQPRTCNESQPCLVFNCPFSTYPEGSDTICRHVTDSSSSIKQYLLDSEFGLRDSSPVEVFLNFAFLGGSSVNGRKFIPARGFNFPDGDESRYVVPCDEEACGRGPCACTNVLRLPPNVTVQMVIMNYQPVFDPKNLPSHHSIHLHGHGFTVLATGFGSRNATTGHVVGMNDDIICDSRRCLRPRWAKEVKDSLKLDNPPVKDTVLVPAQGYAVIRFRTDNPGRWLMHCHQELHSIKGMLVLLDEAVDDQPLPPDGFPSCGDFNWTRESYEHYTMSRQRKSKSEEITSQKNPFSTANEKILLLTKEDAILLAIGFMFLGALIASIPWIIWIRRQRTQLHPTTTLIKTQDEAATLLNNNHQTSL